MSELLSVLKMLGITAAIVMMMQVRIGALTLEERMTDWLEDSPTATWVQGAAVGGATVIRRLSRQIGDAVSDGFQDEDSTAREQRAGRSTF